MIKHHPNPNILAEYAAGTLGFAQSIAVSAHLHFCSQCRHQVHSLEQLGGALFQEEPPSNHYDVSDAVFEQVMQTIDSDSATPARRKQDSPPPSLSELPPIVANLVGSAKALTWKSLSRSLQIATIKTGQHQCEVSLHKISAGGKVMSHDHRGMEYTLVLKGSFSDEDGVYQVGDFLLRQPGEEHTPAAASNRDCICLTVVEGPVRFTGWLSRLLNPFLKIQPQ